MQTVELTCEPALDSTVRAVWARLSEAGVPSLARNTHPTHRPHVTVAACGAFPDGALDRLDGLLAEALPLPVRLTGLVSYSARSRRRVLAWSVVPTVELLTLHRAVWRELEGSAEPNPIYRPGRWSPHLGLTRRVDAAELAGAHEVLGRMPDLSGCFDAARSYDSTPRTTVPLGAGSPEPSPAAAGAVRPRPSAREAGSPPHGPACPRDHLAGGHRARGGAVAEG